MNTKLNIPVQTVADALTIYDRFHIFQLFDIVYAWLLMWSQNSDYLSSKSIHHLWVHGKQIDGKGERRRSSISASNEYIDAVSNPVSLRLVDRYKTYISSRMIDASNSLGLKQCLSGVMKVLAVCSTNQMIKQGVAGINLVSNSDMLIPLHRGINDGMDVRVHLFQMLEYAVLLDLHEGPQIPCALTLG